MIVFIGDDILEKYNEMINAGYTHDDFVKWAEENDRTRYIPYEVVEVPDTEE